MAHVRDDARSYPDDIEEHIPIEPRAGGRIDEAFDRDVCTQPQQCRKALVPAHERSLERSAAMGLFDPGIDVDRRIIDGIGRWPGWKERQTAVATSTQSCQRNRLLCPNVRVYRAVALRCARCATHHW